MSELMPETRLALIHRVIVPDEHYPKEYAILVTDRRSVFIRHEKTRSCFVLRGEMRFGTALVTDVVPKSIEDYEQTSLESLTGDSANITVPHESVISLVMGKEGLKFRLRDVFVWLTMKLQKNELQVYNFEMKHREGSNGERTLRFYMVPLGAWFKPRRMTTSRETILRDYAVEALEVFRRALPPGVVFSWQGAGAEKF